LDFLPDTRPDAALSTKASNMQAVTFDGCFGWLHDGPASSGSDTGVLICTGLGRDASTAHRSFRLLADRLSAEGYPTLRFDYPGTGDSCEIATTDSWTAWQDEVRLAADWLRTNTNVQRIVLIGLRGGATLATLTAAARDDVAGLVLLEPVLRGKSYVAQLTVEARLRSKGVADTSDSLDLDGLPLTRETLDRMTQVDLRQVTLSSVRAISVFSRAPGALLSTCTEAWQNQGASVACSDFDGLEALLRPTHFADEPLADFTQLLSWLTTAVPAQSTTLPFTTKSHEATPLRPVGCVETPLRFGDNDALVGMLCEPQDAKTNFAVVIGNTGGDPHHGFARFSVELARSLAAEGIASLRFDFAGLGDSSNASDNGAEDVTHAFEVDRSADFAAAITKLQQLGFQRFAVKGLCSGAYHAFHAAVTDERVDTLLLVNLPWFSLRLDRPRPASFTRRAMTTLSEREVKTLMLYSEGDAGLKPLEAHFGADAAGLAEFPGAETSTVAGIDHDLTGSAMRQLVAQRLIDFLQNRRPSRQSIHSESDAVEGAPSTASAHALTS
jgi:pimeloyl-ACP methyl ester carboxylesterase